VFFRGAGGMDGPHRKRTRPLLCRVKTKLMANPVALEICVESVEHAVAAERGGADRIELCSDLSSGGVTPSAGLMQTARRHVSVPIHVLIRPRPGNFCYSPHEIEIMQEDIRAAKQIGMAGLVLGILDRDHRIDVRRVKKLIELASPLPVTFHRAFDLAKDRAAALEEVIQTGAHRILTSGGRERAIDALLILRRLSAAAGQRIGIMPCGRINSANVRRIVRATAVSEIHTSVGISYLRSTAKSPASGRRTRQHSPIGPSFEKNVAKLVQQLNGLSQQG
jgi:copper homeostasis protein